MAYRSEADGMGVRGDARGEEEGEERTRRIEEGQPASSHSSGGRVLRARRYRQLVPERVRQKRQTLQAMVRPLKQWLYRHRHNPYPSRQQKVTLAQDSHMTLTQVSNWFANARRRLKNAVSEPGLAWSARIARYNSCVEGNAERFSLDSDDSIWDSEEDDVCNPTASPSTSSPFPGTRPPRPSPLDDHPGSSASSSSAHARPDDVMQVDCPKYKHSILQRYLADAYRQAGHSHQGALLDTSGRGRHQSGSLGSHDSEEMSTSSVSSRHADHHHGLLDDLTEELESPSVRGPGQRESRSGGQEEDMYWKELSAAVVLANLSTGCHWS